MAPLEVDGGLCFRSADSTGSDRRPLICFSQVVRTAAVRRMRLGQEAGHFGRKKTLGRLGACDI